MVANILPTDTPSTQGMGSKGQTIYFLKGVMLHIKFKGNGAQSTIKANMLSLHRPTTPGVGSKGQFFSFSKSGHVAYQIKVVEV